jgi:hypothetical protein
MVIYGSSFHPSMYRLIKVVVDSGRSFTPFHSQFDVVVALEVRWDFCAEDVLNPK